MPIGRCCWMAINLIERKAFCKTKYLNYSMRKLRRVKVHNQLSRNTVSEKRVLKCAKKKSVLVPNVMLAYQCAQKPTI